MAEKSLFYNAMASSTSATGYDRNYNADDISDFFRFSFSTGVVKSNTVNNEPTGLKVVASSGMAINVNAGYACINGKPYINDTAKSFTISANGTSANRYDYIVLRFDNNMSVRDTKLILITGNSTIPTVSNLKRDTKEYDLMLGYITVAPSASSITQTNITDTRGNNNLCPWFTAVKGSADYYDAIVQTHESVVTMASAGLTVTTGLSSTLYNNKYSLIEVYTNGIKEPTSAYTVSASSEYITITFKGQKSAGAQIMVKLDNFIDGEGMTTALAQYTQLLEDVANLKASGTYDYYCNGKNDNVLISNLVKTYFNGGDDYGCMRLNIIGNIGMTAPATGSGTTSNPYGWFDFESNYPNRKVIIDFSRCGEITPNITGGTYNIIFSGQYITIENANVVANKTTSGTIIKVFGVGIGEIRADNCRFYITSYQDATISYIGTFNNCRGSITNTTGNSFCFIPNTNGLVRVYGGEYYAYTGASGSISAIVGQSGANAVSILYAVNAPTNSRSGYYQTNSVYQYTGGGVLCCTDLISALPLSVISGISNIRGTIAKSKAGYM